MLALECVGGVPKRRGDAWRAPIAGFDDELAARAFLTSIGSQLSWVIGHWSTRAPLRGQLTRSPLPATEAECRRQACRRMHLTGILMHMRTTLNIDDALLVRATELSGLREKTAVVRAGLEALVARESARRLAVLGGTDRHLRPVRRRRSTKRPR